MANPNDPNLDIRIKTTGAPAADQDLKKTADSTKRVTEEVKKADDASGKYTTTNRKLAEGFRTLGHDIPIVGAALHFLKNPLTVISLVMVGLIKILRDLHAAHKETADGINDSAKTVADSTGKYRDLKVATDELARAQTQLKEETDRAKEAFDNENKSIDRQFDLSRDLLAAQKELALAGVSDPADRARIEEQFAGGEFRLDIRRAQDKTGLVRREIARQQALQRDVRLGRPDAAALGGALQRAQQAGAEAQGAQVANREAFLDVEALEAATGGKGGVLPGQFERARRLEQEAGSTSAALNFARARQRSSRRVLGAARRIEAEAFGELPPGVGDAEGLGKFISGQNAIADTAIQQSDRRVQELRGVEKDLDLRSANAGSVEALKKEAAHIQTLSEINEQNTRHMLERLRRVEADIKRNSQNSSPR